jgi:putative ABC transport system ATP-binding protein
MDTLRIRDLEFSYKKDSPLLKISSLVLKKGEKVFLKGNSGSGKSTLLSIVTGILSPQKGEVNVLDNNLGLLTQSQKDSLRGESMGYIFQLFNLIPYLSVLDNITLPCRIHSGRFKKLCSLGLFEEAQRLAQALSIEYLLNKPTNELSVGQQQRVAAARALIGSPKFIIADEPTSSLDYNQRENFIKLLMSECEKKETTLLFVSHDPTLAPFFDRSIEMSSLNSLSHEALT